jgi:hypothetical protein
VVASCAATTEAPHWRESRRGRIPKEPLALAEGGTSDTVFPSKVQSFLNYLIAGFLQSESSSDPTDEPQSRPPTVIEVNKATDFRRTAE